MEHFSASSGVIVLQRKQAIESDHKLFAASLQINLIDEEEFDRFGKAIIFPDGSSRYPLSANSIKEIRSLYNRYRQLQDFCDYIYGWVWNEDSRLELLRKWYLYPSPVLSTYKLLHRTTSAAWQK